MLQKICFGLLILTAVFSACTSSDNQASQVAGEVCSCYSSVENRLSNKTKELVIKAADSKDYTATMRDEMEKLDSAERNKVLTELMAFQDMEDSTSPVISCVKQINVRYNIKNRKDKNVFMNEVVKELDKKPGCKVTAALMKMAAKENPQ